MSAYLLGLATPFAIAALVGVTLVLYALFSKDDSAWFECVDCGKRWTPKSVGAYIWHDRVSFRWHRWRQHRTEPEEPSWL